MAPTSLDIFELNDAFAVDDGPPQTPTSPSAVVMPQFLLPELEADADGFALAPAGLDPEPATRQSPNPWSPRLAVDLALAVDSTDEILDRHGLTQEEFARLCAAPAFRRELSVAVREVRENGLAYSERCKVQSMMYLERVDNLIYDNATPASTVLEAIKWIGKMAKLEPKEEKADSGSNGTTVNLQINFAT